MVVIRNLSSIKIEEKIISFLRNFAALWIDVGYKCAILCNFLLEIKSSEICVDRLYLSYLWKLEVWLDVIGFHIERIDYDENVILRNRNLT